MARSQDGTVHSGAGTRRRARPHAHRGQRPRRALYRRRSGGSASLDWGPPSSRTYTTPGDLPGQVTDIAVDDAFVWVATLAGLVRFRLDVVGQ